jgi:galactose-1-phosphate uridylyltransferase
MNEITAGHIVDAFCLAMQFFRRLDEINHPESVYHLINWNYMPASGSSLIHPHLQVFASAYAPHLLQEELSWAKTYLQQQGTNYWDDLVKTEKANGKRFLSEIGRTSWLTVFAPLGVAGDVTAVVDEANCTLDLTNEDIVDLAQGLTKLMGAYDKMGVYNFNMNFFTGSREDDHARFHLVFSPRTFFNQALGTPDVGALRNLYNEGLCMAFPEEINEQLKSEF